MNWSRPGKKKGLFILLSENNKVPILLHRGCLLQAT
jgi:hypothetical protein